MRIKLTGVFPVLLELIILACILMPGILLEKRGMQEPWTLFRLSRVELSSTNSSIAHVQSSASSYTAERLAEDFLFYAFNHLKFFDLELISVLSIGSIVTPLVYFSFAYYISKSKVIAYAFAVYGGWYYPRLVSQYGIQTYVWTNLLFLGFLFFFYQWLENKKAFSSLILLIIFVVTFLFYQTTPLWMITVCIVAYILQLVNEKAPEKVEVSSSSWAIPVFMIVLYFTFDTVFWGNYIGRIASESTTESWMQSFLTKVLSPLSPSSKIPLLPYQISVVNPRIATWSTLISLLLMVLPVVYWVSLKFYRVIKTKSLSSFVKSKEDIFSWAVLAAFATHVIGYSSYGAISIRLIPLAFPIVILIILKNHKYEQVLSYAFAFSLAAVSVIGFLSFFPTTSPDMKPSELGFAPNLIQNGSKILADATTFGEVQLHQSSQGKVYDLDWVDSNKYYAVVNADSSEPISADYIALEKNGKPVTTSNWNSFEPWSQNLEAINKNPHLNKIYDSDNLVLMNKAGQRLPLVDDFAYQPYTAEQTFLEKLIKHFLFFTILLLLPGLAGFFLYQQGAKFPYVNGFSFFFISVMFSICMITIIGYAVNFTFIGLPTLLPAYFLLTVFLLIIVITQKKNKAKVPVREIVVMLALVIIWSAMSSIVENTKGSVSAQYSEFFVTRSNVSNEAYINYFVVNRTGVLQNYDFKFSIDGETIKERTINEMQPNSIVSIRVPVKNQWEGKYLLAELSSDNKVQKDLHFVYSETP